MPENPAALHVVGRTADGKVWHTIRTPTGWTPFGNVLGAAGRLDLEGLGEVVDVAAARCVGPALNGHPEGLYVLLALNDARAVLLFRNADTGAWTQEATAFFPHNARRVAAAVSFLVSQGAGPSRSELHMAVVTDNGFLLTAIHEHGTASPDVPADVEWFAGERGDYRSVAMLGMGAIDAPFTSVELVTANADGRIFTTTGAPNAWSLFADVTGRPGDVVDAAVTSMGAETDYLAVTGDGRVWLAARNGAGIQPWQDLEEVNVVISGGGVEIHTTQIVDVGTFQRVAGAATTEGLHILGVTTGGHLLHQLRPSQGRMFRDVESVGVGQNVGAFTAAACA
ncbi:MAG TPA: hypothetical protein VH834_20650 [Solirubrobacteraceae bacterium]